MSNSSLPVEIIKSDLSLQSYLEENVRENQKHERIRLRVAKAQRTRINHALEVAARNMKVEPISTGSELIKQQQTEKWKCKKAEPAAAPAKLESYVVEDTRRGLRVNCTHCGHSFVHFSKNLHSQYFCSCSRCHLNIRLRHYK
jgi:hypothetical protein